MRHRIETRLVSGGGPRRGRAHRARLTSVGRWRSSPAAVILVVLALGLLGPGSRAAKPTPTASPGSASVPVTSASPSPAVGASPAVGPNGTPATIRTATAEIGHVVWATSLVPGTNAPKERVKSFLTNVQTIYATVPVAWIKKGTTITATWTYNDTAIPGFSTTVTAPAEERELWIEFHLSQKNQTAWPNGTYEIAIAIDGQQATTATVVVGSTENS